MTRARGRGIAAVVAGFVAAATLGTAPPAAAAPAAPSVPNPAPLTDLVAQVFSLGTGGTQRSCGTSGLGFQLRCVENVAILPAGSLTAYAVTYAHWIFCKGSCGPVMAHELVHVGQFEVGGDGFAIQYLAEAALHGTGCENQYERPAYQVDGRCL